jgi:uncharacterized protein with FMN-binding domain
MKKTIVSAILIGIFVLYCFLHAQAAPIAIVPTATPASRSSSSSSSAPTATVTPGTTPTPGATSPSGATYKNGTYMGNAADAQWGVVQIQVVIQNGKITSVQFLQYPNERNRSVEINSYADPILVNEAIQAQSAKVDMVSGATDTSDAFIQSLSNALSQA